MSCPKCSSNIYCKSGFSQGLQRYKINAKVVIIIIRLNIALERGLQRFVDQKAHWNFILEGLGFRSIGRILGFSNISILNWIREFGKKLDALRNEKSVSVVEIDKMHRSIGNKTNDCWIWIAVDRNQHKFINCVTGKRNTKTGKRLWEELKKQRYKKCND